MLRKILLQLFNCRYFYSFLRWPRSVTAKHTFSRQNLLFHGKTYFLTAKHTFSRQNILSHGKTYFFTAKHTFSRQNILSHGKTYFLTAKLTFSRQNILSHGKTYFLTAKLTFSKQFFRFAVKGKHFPMQKRKSFNMVNKEDKVDDSIGNYICNRFTQKYTLRFRISGGCSNKHRGWKLPQDEIVRVRNKRGDGKFGLTVQRSAQIQNTPINIAGNRYLWESCHIYFIHYLGNSTKVRAFCKFLLEKLKM